MGIIIYIGPVFAAVQKFKPPPDAPETAQGPPDIFSFTAQLQSHRDGCCCIFDVVPARQAQLESFKPVRRAVVIEGKVAVFHADMICAVAATFHSKKLQPGYIPHLCYPAMLQIQLAARLQFFGESPEPGFMQRRPVAVDIKVVRIHRKDNRNIGAQVQERPVVFIGFHHHPFRLPFHKVGLEIKGDAAEKSRATDPTLPQEVGRQRSRRSLAMRTRDGNRFHTPADDAQHFGPLFDGRALLPEVLQLSMRVRHCRSVNHQVHALRNTGDVLFVMYVNVFCCQRSGQLG